MSTDTTNVAVRDSTHAILHNERKPKETFDETIRRILEEAGRAP